MDLEEFKAKLDELLEGAEIYIPSSQLAEVLRERADALEEAHGE